MHLNKAVVEAAKPPAAGQDFIRDDPLQGLALHITSNGTRAFVFEGRMRRITLGRYPAMSVSSVTRRSQLNHKSCMVKIRHATGNANVGN